MARSIRAIGERLAEYTTFAAPGERKTLIEKHLNGLAFLCENLAPMHFSAKAAAMVDVIAEFSGLSVAFPLPAQAASA